MPVRLVHRLLQALGLDLKRYTPLNDPHLRRAAALLHHGVDVVVDGGANVGEYALQLRRAGYRGRIHSFEPRGSAFAELARSCGRDGRWACHPFALGRESGERALAVSANGVSSSLLPPAPDLERIFPGARRVGEERVRVVRLADLWDELELGPPHRALLKLDVQGAERDALAGAGARLEECALLELELPLRPMYAGAASLEELVGALRARGFEPIGFTPNDFDAARASVMEVDVLFARSA
jgi:FkbM family methyltransferase